MIRAVRSQELFIGLDPDLEPKKRSKFCDLLLSIDVSVMAIMLQLISSRVPHLTHSYFGFMGTMLPLSFLVGGAAFLLWRRLSKEIMRESRKHRRNNDERRRREEIAFDDWNAVEKHESSLDWPRLWYLHVAGQSGIRFSFIGLGFFAIWALWVAAGLL